MNDCMTQAMALLPGARNGPVGTPSGMKVVSSLKLGTKRAGNSLSDRPALSAARSPWPKVTK